MRLTAIILALVLLVLACLGIGYQQGVSRESDRRDALALKQVGADIVAADKESTRREGLGEQRETSRQRVRVVYVKIKESADESVKRNPAGYDCVMDSNGLRAWNAANAGTAEAMPGEPVHLLLDAALGEIGTSGRATEEPYRGDGAIHTMPGSAQEAGGLREPSKVAQ